jgi:carboxylate-amine ligase
LIDFGKGEIVPCADLIEELIEMTRDDAEALGCADEILNCRDIMARGTSAHRQLGTYNNAIAGGRDKREALCDVVDMLIQDTVSGL